MFKASQKASITLMALLLISSTTAYAAMLQDQDIAEFHFSGMVITPEVPALACIITAPANTNATLDLDAYLYEKAAQYPYAHLLHYGITIASNEHTNCDLNNGVQQTGGKQPDRIELQVRVTRFVFTGKQTFDASVK